MRRLNPRQRKFAELYASGPDDIRGDGTACYMAAGYRVKSPRVAEVNASRLLSNAIVSGYIGKIHREAEARLINQMRDWKALAPAAQSMIFQISQGLLPNPHNRQATPVPIKNRDDAAAAKVIADQCQFIVERAYPSKVFASGEIYDPLGAIAGMFGITVEQLVAIEGYSPHGPTDFDA